MDRPFKGGVNPWTGIGKFNNIWLSPGGITIWGGKISCLFPLKISDITRLPGPEKTVPKSLGIKDAISLNGASG